MKRSVFLLLDHYLQREETLHQLHAFVLDHARLADALGFEALWLAEHHFQQIGTVPNPAVVLAAIAAQTRRLRIGPAVSVLPYRSPTMVAEDYALVDLQSDGRLNMGVGCGSQKLEFTGLEVDFESRWEVFQRNLVTLRELWAGSTLNVSCRQKPTPPIYVATTNADNARTIARGGDSVITLLPPTDEATLSGLAPLVEAHRQGLREGGHPKEAAEVVVAQFAHAAPSDAVARRHAVPALSRLLTLLSADGSHAESVYDSMRREATGCLGSPAHVQATISALENAGVQHVAFITRFGGLHASAAHDSLRLLAPTLDKTQTADSRDLNRVPEPAGESSH